MCLIQHSTYAYVLFIAMTLNPFVDIGSAGNLTTDNITPHVKIRIKFQCGKSWIWLEACCTRRQLFLDELHLFELAWIVFIHPYKSVWLFEVYLMFVHYCVLTHIIMFHLSDTSFNRYISWVHLFNFVPLCWHNFRSKPSSRGYQSACKDQEENSNLVKAEFDKRPVVGGDNFFEWVAFGWIC